MVLRGFNNPQDILTVMDVFKQLIAVDPLTLQPNTRLGEIMASTDKDLIYVQQRYQMLLGPKPALLIESGPQKSRLAAGEGRDGEMTIRMRYVDVWDTQPDTIDNIKRNNMIDLMRMQSNLENNDATIFRGANYSMSLPEITLSGYDGTTDDITIPGTSFVVHDLEILVFVLPYRV